MESPTKERRPEQQESPIKKLKIEVRNESNEINFYINHFNIEL